LAVSVPNTKKKARPNVPLLATVLLSTTPKYEQQKRDRGKKNMEVNKK